VKKITVAAILLVLLASQALAMSPVDTLVIKDAQEYGRRMALENYSTFMAPWTAFEEKAQKLNDFTEHAYIFTPYIIVASDAREQALKNQVSRIENSEQALAQYNGFLVFSVDLYAQEPASLEKLTVKLIQGQRVIPTYYVNPAKKSRVDVNGKLMVSTQYYLYFEDKAILRNKPVILHITDRSDRMRSFFFDLGKIL
jgi:hypothetical protein